MLVCAGWVPLSDQVWKVSVTHSPHLAIINLPCRSLCLAPLRATGSYEPNRKGAHLAGLESLNIMQAVMRVTKFFIRCWATGVRGSLYNIQSPPILGLSIVSTFIPFLHVMRPLAPYCGAQPAAAPVL